MHRRGEGMKRIVGKKMWVDQSDSNCTGIPDYVIEVVDPQKINVSTLPFRFQWVSNTIDGLSSKGFMPLWWLDIGSFNGEMAIIAAMKSLYPREPKNMHITTGVDAIEPNNGAFKSLEQMVSNNKSLSITPHHIHFEKYETDRRYSVVTAFEVLEHTHDPLFCIEKIYDLMEIGGYLFLTVPEESGMYGIHDHSPWHYWASTVQSLVSVMFNDDRKWHINNVFEMGGLIHLQVQKKVFSS